MSGVSSSTALWYTSRATGVVSLVLLSAVLALGVLVNRQGRLPGLPRFAATSLHRSLSLLAVVFVGVHVLSAVADSYVSIRLAAVVLPGASAYEPLWMGLGAVTFDLMLAVVVTSLLRRHLPRAVWRAVHWLTYASWVVAVAHGFGADSDLRGGALLAVGIGCLVLVAGAVGWRVVAALRVPGRVVVTVGSVTS